MSQPDTKAVWSRRWQDDRDDELDAPEEYPQPEPDHPYTPNQS